LLQVSYQKNKKLVNIWRSYGQEGWWSCAPVC